MGMFADGGLTTTKVYISSSSYIKTQSDSKPDGIWDKDWTILYYYFIYRNYDKLEGRSAIYKSHWDKHTDKEMIKKVGKQLVIKYSGL
jgi:deoxyribodipyrimidine photolyase-related protein